MADDLNCSACGARCNLGEHCVWGSAPHRAPRPHPLRRRLRRSAERPEQLRNLLHRLPQRAVWHRHLRRGCRAVRLLPPGYTLCNGACVDLTSDLFNCGSCGYSCNIGKSPTCEGSVCYNGGVCRTIPEGRAEAERHFGALRRRFLAHSDDRVAQHAALSVASAASSS